MKNRSLIVSLLALCTVGVFAFQGGDADKKKDTVVEKIKGAMPTTDVKPKVKRKLLVFSVTRGYRHGSIKTGKKALTLLGQETGAFEAVVSDDLANFEADKIKEFDAICFLNTTHEVFSPSKVDFSKMNDAQKAEAKVREDRLKKNLVDFIKSGKGFVGIHSASDTFFKWPEYGEMIGGYFNGHPWNSNTSVSIKVEEGKEKHPLIAHLNGKSLDFKEEIYQLKEPYDSKKYDMLLRLDVEKSDMNVKGIKRKDNDFGVSWVKKYGEGRVFYCSLGHNDHIYWNSDVLKLYLSGIQYVMGDLEIEPKK